MQRSGLHKLALLISLITLAASATSALAHGFVVVPGNSFGYAALCYQMQGAMGDGMMGQGIGPRHDGHGHGMMGQGRSPDMMGQGIGPRHDGHGHGMMGQGMGPRSGSAAPNLDRDLGVDEVKSIVGQRLKQLGNERLRVGKVEEKDADVIIAEVETVDGSLVERYVVDWHTGRMQRTN